MNIQLRGTCWCQPASLLPDPHSTETHEEFIAHFNHTQRMNWQEYQADRPIIYILFAYPSDRSTSTFPMSIFFHLLQGQLGMQCSLGPPFKASSLGAPIRAEESFPGGKGEVCRRVGGLCFSWLRMKRDFFTSFPSLLPATYLILSAGAWPCAWSCGVKTLSDLHYRFAVGQTALFALWGQVFALSFLCF